MKKLLILSTVLLFTSLISQAQTSKGDQTLGTDLGFSYTKNNQVNIDPSSSVGDNIGSGKTTTFNVSPNYSYFIANNLDIGVALGYTSSITNNTNTNNDYESKVADKSYGATIFVRKYYMYQNIGLRLGAYLNYNKQINSYDYPSPNSINDYDSNQDNYSGGLTLDFVYYPTKHIGFSAALANLSYRHSKDNYGDQGNDDQNNFNFGYINNGLDFSVFYVFGGK